MCKESESMSIIVQKLKATKSAILVGLVVAAALAYAAPLKATNSCSGFCGYGYCSYWMDCASCTITD